MIIKNGTVLDGNFEFVKKDIFINNNIIENIDENLSGEDELNAEGLFVVPGFVDIHTHGAMGYETIDEDEDGIYKMSSFLLSKGVTSFSATLSTASFEVYKNAFENIKRAKENGCDNIRSIHLEGPYFSTEFKGAQNELFIRNPDVLEIQKLYEISNGLLKLISIAPEKEGSVEFIKKIKDNITVSIGHTSSDYETALNAISAGASNMTHAFNAMNPLHHRSPNAVGASLDSNITCEFICDGIHVDPVVLRLMYKICGSDRFVIISDSLRTAGLSDGEYISGGLKMIMKDGVCRLENGTIAGSSSNMHECVKNMINYGIKPEYVFKSASLTPAKVVRADKEIGSIEKGKYADLVILDKNYDIKNVIMNGKVVCNIN